MSRSGLGIDLGSGGRRDGPRDGRERKQDSPAGVGTRGLHGPRENTSMRGSAERTPRSFRSINSASAPPPSPLRSLPAAVVPAPLFSAPPPRSSIDTARSAALSALTMAEGVVTPACVRPSSLVVPLDEDRPFPPPKPAPEDVGKTNEKMLSALLGQLMDEQTGWMVGGVVDPGKVTTPKSINRLRSGSAGSTTPTSQQPLQGTFSPSSPAYTPTRRGNLPSLTTSTSFSGFSVASPRLDSPRADRFFASIPRKPVQASPSKQDLSSPVKFEQYVVKVTPPDVSVPEYQAPIVYCYRIHGTETHFPSDFLELQKSRDPNCQRPAYYYFEDERKLIKAAVNHRIKQEHSCNHCEVCKVDGHCEKCRNYWFAYYELKTMVSTFTPEERKRIIDGNRSLRTIKTELDNLLENDAITNEVYDMMMDKLPAETPLNGSRPAPSRDTSAVEAPPAYNNPTAPSLPTRQTTRPEICRVKALYPYNASDANDCTFVVEDEIIVYEKVNDDWWMGKNVRSGKEGVFPSSYTVAKAVGPAMGFQGGVKAQPYNSGYQAQPQQYQQQTPYQPSPSQSYSAPSAPSEPGKGAEMGKKVGKKLGNAALFGAGATIGSNIVNSIF